MTYRVEALPESVSTEVRQTMRAPGYGHPAYREIAQGYGPCRSCLGTFAEGRDYRILFTYDPFLGLERYPLPGPIFIHAEACEPYGATGEFPEDLRFIPLTLNAYGQHRHLRDVVRLEPHGDIEAAIEALFARDDVDYIHVRNTEAGCFILHVTRG